MNGSPEFYELLKEAAELHDRKSHDYASNDSPFANYLFAGKMSKLFNNPDDSGFLGRLSEKIFRLANLDNSGKLPFNEGVVDTERDIAVIATLWMAMRRAKVNNLKASTHDVNPWIDITVIPGSTICCDCGLRIDENKATAKHTGQGNLFHHMAGMCPDFKATERAKL